MKESSKLPLFDLRKLNAALPVPSVPNNTTEVLVVGAINDFIVVSEPPSTSQAHSMMQYLASEILISIAF
jgi:hypothetical protein